MISVIVPVYKVEQYLDQCVESILAQTYRDFELLLVDDGSPDRCGVMCDEWAAKDRRIRVFHKANGGLSDARNYALDRMRGDYVVFVDSDDWISADCLEYQLRVLQSAPDAKVAAFGYLSERRGKTFRCVECEDAVIDNVKALRRVMYERGMAVCAWAKIYVREVFESLRYKVGMVMEDEYLIGEVLCRAGKIVLGSEAHYHYRQREDSIVHQVFVRKKYDDQISAMHHLCDVARSFGSQMDGAIRRREARDRMSLLRLMDRCERQFLPLRAQLRQEVLKRWRILLDKEVCTRDKIGLLALVPGYWSFGLLWSLYERVRRS